MKILVSFDGSTAIAIDTPSLLLKVRNANPASYRILMASTSPTNHGDMVYTSRDSHISCETVLSLIVDWLATSGSPVLRLAELVDGLENV